MLFPYAKLLALALTFTSAIASPIDVEARDELDKRATHVVIGYRRVHPKQAEIYAKAGETLVLDKEVPVAQLGQGVYTSQERDGWPANADHWYCIITANKAKLDAISKAWIPENEWFDGKGEKKIEAYLKQLHVDPKQTLRLSKIKGFNELQMLIPPALIGKKKNDRGPLDIYAKCAKTPGTGPAPPAVDYAHWTKVVGQPQH
ncbi:hypothetical protein BDV27DRAFT_155646 [Aspergillus caelatus]|uniref:Uncharacterized protein n=2 Tax=Aspergillus subgen. Circumdati TaxID=2720871 RepID=A0A5N7AC81_9EURO|nr:uncharacterized protein BDV27DRAFT_155646 [Aspergillus caelatus]KAE8366756.1 hypothetical protein BDV27DRAFT_155646 [Aspergillus caelatus]KAE8423688.1 hypothetical protein BDV36DRAFT_290354 [Aspergillus pseudocaelatus]